MFLYWNFPLRHFGSQRFPQSLIRNRVSHLVFSTGQPTNATLELRDQVTVLSDEYNKLFNQFSAANSRLDSSADGSSD